MSTKELFSFIGLSFAGLLSIIVAVFNWPFFTRRTGNYWFLKSSRIQYLLVGCGLIFLAFLEVFW